MVEKSLQEVKKDYEEFQIRYSLPSFDELNRAFSIEKVTEDETDFLLREIRKYIADKYSNYHRFVELLINPANASVFVFSILKGMNADDKKLIENLYKKLSKLNIRIMEVDIIYSEEKEAEFIQEAYREWNSIREDWIKIIESIKKNWDNGVKKDSEEKKYFG